jgi:hypothetical protein
VKSDLEPGGFGSPGFLILLSGIVPAALLVAFFLLCPLWERFVLEEIRTGRILYCDKPDPVLEFALSYTHSVNKSVVTDNFSVGESGTVFLRSSEFSSFGAGVAAGPEVRGTFTESGGKILYGGIDRPLSDFRLFAGTESDHLFRSADDTFRLRDRTAPQTALRFRMRRTTAMEIAFYFFVKGVLHG